MFVRFGGCDFRCQMCDSMHAVDPKAVQKHATRMDYKEITRILEEAYHTTGVKWVTFSGGNPVMYDLTQLVEQLRYNGWLINVETQGTLWRDWLNLCDVITVSPKSMGMGEKFDPVAFEKWVGKVTRPLCVKVVVFSAQDFEFALYVEQITKDALAKSGQADCLVVFYLSLGNPYPPKLTEDYELIEHVPFPDLKTVLLRSYRELSEEVLQDRRLKNWKFLPQLHVLVYGNETGR